MLDLLESVSKLTDEVIDLVSAPAVIAVETARVLTEPLAEVAREVTDAAKGGAH